MMRVDLPAPIKPGQKTIINIDWNYNIPDRMAQAAAAAMNCFGRRQSSFYNCPMVPPPVCLQRFPGWQNQQFTGRGEFALTFGNLK
jgi:hypothetical protein